MGSVGVCSGEIYWVWSLQDHKCHDEDPAPRCHTKHGTCAQPQKWQKRKLNSGPRQSGSHGRRAPPLLGCQIKKGRFLTALLRKKNTSQINTKPCRDNVEHSGSDTATKANLRIESPRFEAHVRSVTRSARKYQLEHPRSPCGVPFHAFGFVFTVEGPTDERCDAGSAFGFICGAFSFGN